MNRDRHVGIVEIAEICAGMRALSLDLFTELGGWVSAAPSGWQQRWYTIACHRHAWHADLWAERSPAIPVVDLDEAVSSMHSRRLPTVPDEAAYRNQLTELAAELDSIADRVDRDLDPSTRRAIMLVRNDIDDLQRV